MAISVQYEVIGRAVTTGKAIGQPGNERHALRLLYRGDGTPWWTCSSGLDLPIPAESDIQSGDFVMLTIEKI